LATDEQADYIPEIMTAPRPTSPADTKPKITLSIAQVTATGLASVTSAVLGSSLGAAGTLIGAAVASVIFTVATAVYRVYLERGGERVRSLVRHAWPSRAAREGSGERARTEHPRLAAENVPPGDGASGDAPPGNAPSGNAPAGDATPGDEAPGDKTPGDKTPADKASGGRFRRFATLRWGAVAVVATGSFVLAMMAITGFELARGETIGGNGEGTTLGRVADAPPGPQDPAVPSTPPSSGVPTSGTPTESSATPTESSGTLTETTTPSGAADAEPDPSRIPGEPAPSEVRPTPPLLPTGFPGAED
jgi:hypothetical protein